MSNEAPLPTFQVLLQPEAIAGIESAFRWIEEHSPEAAREWRRGMYEALRSLSRLPQRCPLAPENGHFSQEIRQLLYTRKGSAYRILFTVQEDVVSVLYVRHTAQARLTSKDK